MDARQIVGEGYCRLKDGGFGYFRTWEVGMTADESMFGALGGIAEGGERMDGIQAATLSFRYGGRFGNPLAEGKVDDDCVGLFGSVGLLEVSAGFKRKRESIELVVWVRGAGGGVRRKGESFMDREDAQFFHSG